jgi:hypothetical protein
VVVTLVTAEERRDVDTLMRQAGVSPDVADAAPGSASLIEVTGARRPSGVPVEAPKPPQQQPAAGTGRRRRGRGGEQRPGAGRAQAPSDGRSGGQRSRGRRGGRGGSPRTAA